MNSLKDRTDKDLQPLVGTKVKVTDDKGKVRVGELQFAGVNEFHKHFQVTLDRMPIWPVDKNTVKPFTTE